MTLPTPVLYGARIRDLLSHVHDLLRQLPQTEQPGTRSLIAATSISYQNALAGRHLPQLHSAHYNRSAQQIPFPPGPRPLPADVVMGKKQPRSQPRPPLPSQRLRQGRGQSHQSSSAPWIASSRTLAAAETAGPRRRLSPRKSHRHSGGFPTGLSAITSLMPTPLLSRRPSSQRPKQIRPGGRELHAGAGKVQVAGQVAVMAINGLLTKSSSTKPTNEFFVEEQLPLDG